MRAEINQHVALVDDGGEIVARVQLAGEFQFLMLRQAMHQRLTHAAFVSVNDDFNHGSWQLKAGRWGSEVRYSQLPASNSRLFFYFKIPHALSVA